MARSSTRTWEHGPPERDDCDQISSNDEDSGYSEGGWDSSSGDDIEESRRGEKVGRDSYSSPIASSNPLFAPSSEGDSDTATGTLQGTRSYATHGTENERLLSLSKESRQDYPRVTERSHFCSVRNALILFTASAFVITVAWAVHHFVLVPPTGAGVMTKSPQNNNPETMKGMDMTMLPGSSKVDSEAIMTSKVDPEAQSTAPGATTANIYFNGTHKFRETVLLISLDGFRADYFDRNLTPNLARMASNGVQAEYLIPCFPTVTFPNHHSIMTGLYPEAHGIIGNEFWDGEDEFYYTDPKRSWASKWWGGEPIWWTAESQKTVSAMLMWPGTSTKIKGRLPTYWIPYSNALTLKTKVDQIMNWLDIADTAKRPQLLSLYIPDIDKAGHAVGPFGKRVDRALRDVDNMIGDLMSRLASRNLSEIVHTIVLSDHGMSTTEHERLVFLDEVIDMNDIEHLDGWPLWGIRPKQTANSTDMILALQKAASTSNKTWAVYAQDPQAKIFDPPLSAGMQSKLSTPVRWHFTQNSRIAPIHAVPEPGYALTSHYEFEVKMDGEYRPKGVHGYDNARAEMRAILVLSGNIARLLKENATKKTEIQAWKRQMLQNSTMEPFMNLEIYNLIAKLLHLRPAPNNGTTGFWDKYF